MFLKIFLARKRFKLYYRFFTYLIKEALVLSNYVSTSFMTIIAIQFAAQTTGYISLWNYYTNVFAPRLADAPITEEGSQTIPHLKNWCYPNSFTERSWKRLSNHKPMTNTIGATRCGCWWHIQVIAISPFVTSKNLSMMKRTSTKNSCQVWAT